MIELKQYRINNNTQILALRKTLHGYHYKKAHCGNKSNSRYEGAFISSNYWFVYFTYGLNDYIHLDIYDDINQIKYRL